MFKQIALITWQEGGDAQARDALLRRAEESVQANFSFRAPTTAASFNGGDIVWHLHFDNEAAWAASGVEAALDLIEKDPQVASLDAAAYEAARFGVGRPDIVDGIYRTLLIGVARDASEEAIAEFVEDLAAMPAYIPEILNWAMNPVSASRGAIPWTHVWEQEFADEAGLTGPYMMNPYHWAWVDRWFDHEMPCQIIANDAIRHSASLLPKSVMTDY